MEIKTSTVVKIVLAGVLQTVAISAQACCPDTGHGAPTAPTMATGLGESAPKAPDLSLDPSWHIYEFKRDGVSYLQISDLTGTVRAAVGNISGTLWVLPMGVDVSRVSLPTKWSDSRGTLVYQTSAFTVRAIPSRHGNKWEIKAAD
ncbi:hypothetical protein [Xanthomonas sp. MUS 060]|uniref:hypothetical protein n=1 Tax=Xanthomonas sp. MUS 060 TaxID=1588031 RepID=UPI0005F2A8C5|nr:hypothetical protein [Xanthomonas sp. MUS 060]